MIRAAQAIVTFIAEALWLAIVSILLAAIIAVAVLDRLGDRSPPTGG